jgi:DNA (cytosine-5)-methyltransferase 1
MFSGIGGFEYGIEQAHYNIKQLQRTTTNNECENRRSKSDLSGEWEQNSRSTQGIQGNRSESSIKEWECIGYSEIDKHAISVFRKHYPHTKNFGDATKIIPAELPDFELICGGFPCQSFSIAGKRMGFEDTRGTLFFDIARIIKIKRPRIVFLENVAGLLSHDRGRTFTTILATLDELGYNVEWEVLNSKYFGVPQNRERVFIIGHIRGSSSRQVFPLGQSCEESDSASGETRSEGERIFNYSANAIAQRDYKGGNQLVSCAYRTRTLQGQDGHIEIRKDGVANQLTTCQKDSMVMAAMSYGTEDSKPEIGQVFRRYGVNGVVPPLQNWSPLLDGNRIRRLTPVECERLQAFPDGWTEEGLDENNNVVKISDTQRYKMCGNAVTTKVIQAITERIMESN